MDTKWYDSDMSLGKRIRAARTVKGMTQVELAEKIAKAPQTLSNWETDRSEPSLEEITQLAAFTETPLDRLLGVSNSEGVIVMRNTSAAYEHGGVSASIELRIPSAMLLTLSLDAHKHGKTLNEWVVIKLEEDHEEA
jgi:transcriptional regulator with XRE-family HTH domain